MKRIKKLLLSVMVALMVIRVVPEGIAGFKTCVEVQAATTVATPKLVSAKASGTSKVKVTWKKISGVTGYRLYRRTDGTSWKTVKTISGSSNVTYTDSKLKPGTRYYYTVKAYKKTGGKTYWSKYNTKGVYAVTGLKTPNVKTITSISFSEINLSWDKIEGASGYYVYRRKNTKEKWSIIADVPKNTLKYTDTTCVDDTRYYYTIRAYSDVSGRIYKSGYNTKGWSCTSKKMTELEAMEIEISETEYSILAKVHNRSRNFYYALDLLLELYDDTGKIVYRSSFGNAYYHVQPDRTIYTRFSKPQNSKGQYVSYSYCKIIPKSFGTINYKADIYDKIEIGQVYTKDDKICVDLRNTTDEVVCNGRVIFVFYKNGNIVHTSDGDFYCNVYEECETSTRPYVYDFQNNQEYSIDYDKVEIVMSHAFVSY